MGAVAVAAAILVAPSAAFANDDTPALLKFQLDNASLYDDFEALGFDMDHDVDNGEGDDIIVSAWVTDEQLQLARAHGYENVGVVHSKENFERIRAESLANKEAELAAKKALTVNEAGVKGKSAAPGSVRLQRADFYENYEGRYLSIEANTDGVSYTGSGGNIYNGPTLVAEWFDAAGTKLGQTVLEDYPDTGVNPDFYMYHYRIARLGNKGDGGADPAYVKIASSNGDVDTLAAKEWIAKDPPRNAATFKSGFVTRYNDSVDAYQKMRDLATEFSNISQSYELPKKTWGYQRPAATMLGYANTNNNAPNATTPYVRFDDNNLPVAGSAPSTAQQAQTVVITSKTMGHLGGNSLTAQLIAPTGANQPLTVSLTGNAIRVNVASGDAVTTTNPDGTTTTTYPVTSTANQVIAALNANPDTSRVIRATKYRTASGNGIVTPGIRSPLSDLLRAPAFIQRGPQSMAMLRIGKHRDGSKVGVYLYCAEHSGEIATVGVCLETAERLVRNYGTDPQTTALVDNLDIFIVPVINGDGGIHSIYDSPRRTNMAPYCYDPANTENLGDPANRNSYGVNINRNFSVGSTFDGFVGASSSCSGGNNAGPFELSEPETSNEIWVQNTFRNIKFSNNIHSSGGFFMWPPGAYKPTRETLPYPPYGTLNFFDQAGKQVLDRIKSHRGTAILPQQTGPVIDVLYSAAGNSADEAYYTLGIVGYDFEIGADRYNANGVQCQGGPGQQPPFGDSTNDCFDNEGFHEAMEFSDGNYGLLQSAFEYSRDVTAPVVTTESKLVADASSAHFEVRFKSDEASSIYYTTDGSTPTTASTEYKPPRPRALPLPLEIPVNGTLKWIAHDFKGNTSEVKSQKFEVRTDVPGGVGGAVPATLSLTLGTPASFGAFTPGITNTYTASSTATVISSAGNAALSVADPSSIGTGHLVNGSFILAQPLRARAAGGAFSNVGSAAAPLSLKTYDGPISNDVVSLEFSQLVNANDPLRTGTYSKALTFTLSTTQP